MCLYVSAFILFYVCLGTFLFNFVSFLQDRGEITSKPAYSQWAWFSSDLILVWSFRHLQSDLFFGFKVESQIVRIRKLQKF